MSNNDFAFIIPAYNPDENLIELIKDIRKKSDLRIFILDDGSIDSTQNIFDKLKSKELYHNMTFLKHEVNLGKGAALKNLFNHVLVNYPTIKAVVTLDSDGQHSVKDCLRVLYELEKEEKTFVLGHRTFSGDIPLKSYLGNNISKFIYRIILGRGFKDTQTGLRGLNRNFMRECLKIKSNRFEFETEQLALSVRKNIEMNIIEIPIETIYIENNKATSFRPIVDSFRIYFVLFRYAFSSILTALVDFLIFIVVLQFGGNIFISNIVARTFATFVQFILLKKFVFNTRSGIKTFTLFYFYVLIIGGISSWLQMGISQGMGINEVSSKIIIEVFLFFVNFAFLRVFIFRKKDRE